MQGPGSAVSHAWEQVAGEPAPPALHSQGGSSASPWAPALSPQGPNHWLLSRKISSGVRCLLLCAGGGSGSWLRTFSAGSGPLEPEGPCLAPEPGVETCRLVAATKVRAPEIGAPSFL